VIVKVVGAVIETVFPMIPAGAAHNEILLGKQARLYVQKDLNAV
jgi:hypothetical protein